MTSPGRKSSVGRHVDLVSSLGARMPMTPPVSSDNVHAVAENHSDEFQPKLNSWEMDETQMKGSAMNPAGDHIETTRPEPASLNDNTGVSNNVQNLYEQQPDRDIVDTSQMNTGDYFTPQLPPAWQDMSPGGLHNTSQPEESSNPGSPGDHPNAWQNSSLQHQVTPFNSGNPRPTSVPTFQSKASSRRREGPEYPNYPDQSFKALQHQQYPPPYRPNSPRPLRTRSSHLSQGSSSQVDPHSSSTDLPRIPSGAKSLGNTPAQSPGLFTTAFPANRQPSRNDDGMRSNTPMLHPTHHKPPKETHKLLKDIDPISGRKTINHYEIFQKLGSGQHGTVKQGRNLQSGEMVAIKIVRRFSKKLRLGRSGDPNDMIKKEVAILKKARHPHVVSLIEVIDDDEFGKVYLVLEFVDRGEIIWRKQTDKDICAFEMARTQRELAGDVDAMSEQKAVEDFNRLVPARRLEKARLIDKKRLEARDRYGSPPFGQSGSDFWSLEFQDPEGETGLETQTRIEAIIEDRTRAREGNIIFGAAKSSPQTQSPAHTPKPHTRSTDSGSAPASVPSTRPQTPARLEGTMYGPYVEDPWPKYTLQSTLDEIIHGEIHWTEEEEDFRYVPCLTLNQCNDAFRDTVLGLEYLHYQGIIHRDIKPANLLWTSDYRVKISDFGVSYLGKPIREDDNKEEIPEADAAILDEAIELAKTVGTPAFYAPELCDPQYFEIGKHPDRPAITGQIDVWALGVTLYGMVFGRLPFFHHNEFQMYERIAREEVYIPRKRLKGVEHTDKTPSNSNKRLDDCVDYEDVDDELCDLLKRLLNKVPSKRITLKEVKHHPWVLRCIGDQMSWMDETDPSLQSQGRKIEVSTQEVQNAVIGLTVFDRVKTGIQRIGSVLRGRGSRKRGDSNPKAFEPTPLEPPPPPPPPPPVAVEPTKVCFTSHPDRRSLSLQGAEKIYSALRASRDHPEHPLAHSVAVSPEFRSDMSYFDEAKPPRPVSDPQVSRPSFPDRTLSTADSMRTVRAPAPIHLHETLPSASSPHEDFSTTTAVPDSNQSSSSSLGGIFGGAGRLFANSMRSRERGAGGHSPSQSSRSSSIDRGAQDPHASPSLALSSAIAAGHVDQPLALHEELQPLYRPPPKPGVEAIERAHEQNYRRQNLEHRGHARRPTVSLAAEVACPPSPDDELFFGQQRPASAADSAAGFQISSSSDQILSGDSTIHSRIPSVVSGASSLSATIEEMEDPRATHDEKSFSPPIIGDRTVSQHRERGTGSFSGEDTIAKATVEDEAGYNGEGEQDSDSEDEGLAMA